MMYQFVRSSLADITRDLNKASETVITGKRINTLSDDPMDMAMAAGIKSTLDGLKQMDRNISMGNSWLTASESALTHAQDLISETKTLALQMANASISTGNRQDAAVMVQQTMEEMISLANTTVDGRYIFSGNRTDVPSFAKETDEIDENIENIVYQGDSHPFSIKVGTDSLIEIGGDGAQIFSRIFETLAAFKTSLESETDDLDGINEAIESLDIDFEHLNSEISAAGSRMNRLDMKSSLLQEMKINETQRLSALEDADIIEAITRLEQMQLSYQAALSSSSKLMSMNLLDYLK
jgi:flagellar hook-associated protein 3 FlgL